MSVRIGIAIGRGAVRAVALRAEKIVWAGEAPLASIDALQASITTLLAQAPATRWSRPVLHAAIGPHGAQVKRVVGLPEIGDVEALTAIVREAAGTYFLKNGIPLVTTRVRLAGAGSAVAAAVDRPYVEAIRAACQAKGYRAGPIAPTAIALLGALTDESFRWNDGSLTIDISRTGRQLDTVRTRPATSADDDAVTAAPVPALAVLGTDALRYADAFGAATVDAHEPLAIQSDSSRRDPRARRPRDRDFSARGEVGREPRPRECCPATARPLAGDHHVPRPARSRQHDSQPGAGVR